MYYVTVWRSEHSFEKCSPSTSEAGYLLLLLCCWLPTYWPLNFLGIPPFHFALSLGIMGLQPCHTSSLYHRDLFCGPWESKSAHLDFAASVFTVELSCWTPFLRQVLSLTWSLSIGLSSVNKLQGAPWLHCSPLAQGHQQQASCCFFLGAGNPNLGLHAWIAVTSARETIPAPSFDEF